MVRPYGTVTGLDDEYIEITEGDTRWRFERAFLESNWRCTFGDGCKGILPTEAPELVQGCCSHGAHLGDGGEGRTEALNLSAYASVLDADQWEYHAVGPTGIFSDDRRNHTRVIDGACVFLNRPGFAGGAGCALHIGALASAESPIDWKPSVCWQLPIRVDWDEADDNTETATVRRWRRSDWGRYGETMAWCCTERSDGGEAYSGSQRVVDSLGAELTAIAGESVAVQLRARLRDA